MNTPKPLIFLVFLTVFAAPVRAEQSPLQAAIEQLASDSVSVRRDGVAALGRLRSRDALPPLARALKDEDGIVRRRAVDALAAHRANAKEYAGDVEKLFRTEKDAGLRQAAAIALGHLRDEAAAPALIAALDDANDGVRSAAMRALGMLRSAAAVKPLTAIVSSTKQPGQNRVAAASTLGEIGGDDVVATLAELLDDKDLALRRAAVEALARSRSSAAVSPLRGMLADRDKPTRVKAVVGLAALGDDGGRELAITLLGDEEPGVRTQAASALGIVGDAKDAYVALKKAVKDEKDPGVKRVLEYAANQLKARHGIVEEKKK